MPAMNGVNSLLSFLAAPIVVGDPEGNVIYVNPAYERAFGKSAEEALGVPLAMLFEGGGREAILRAVAEVCSRGQSIDFKLKEGGGAWLGLASPIEAADDRVGVVMLLTEEPGLDDRLMAFQGEISEPLEEVQQALDELLEQTGGRRAERYRMLVERGAGALERARKWNDELHRLLCGRGRGPTADATLDPVRVARQVVGRLSAELEDTPVSLRLLAPAQLPPASGDATMLETALTRLIRHRAADPQTSSHEHALITLSVRSTDDAERPALVFSVVDRPGVPSTPDTESDVEGACDPEPRAVRATVAALGGRVRTLADPEVGRVTAIELSATTAT